MQIDASGRHPMRCSPVDEPAINVQALSIEAMTPPELHAWMLGLAGRIRRGEVVDGAEVVCTLRTAASFFQES